MKLLLYKETHTGFKQIGMPWLAAGVSAVLVLFAVAGYAGAQLFGMTGTTVVEVPSVPAALALELDHELDQQRVELETLQRAADMRADAMAIRLAELQARLIRIEALGQRLTDTASIDSNEFDFDLIPAQGGPDVALGDDVEGVMPQVEESLASFAAQLDSRERQLEVIEQLILTDELAARKELAGRPVLKGFLSSAFGKRRDPFNGRVRFHEGVDFAARRGDPIVAIGAGVVSWSGRRSGYGLVVEVNHGDGLVTRYAHNSKNLVKVGDAVVAGQVLGTVGSTGRSTGPHLHFEVLKDGRPVNPVRYTRKARAEVKAERVKPAASTEAQKAPS